MTAPTAGFNLVEDPWIPLGDREASLREVFSSGHDLPGWPSGEPLASSAIIRLLLPIVFRITGMDQPMHRQEFAARQRRLLDAGRLDAPRAQKYLNRWIDRFWLIRPPAGVPPFAQDPTLGSAEAKPISKLMAPWASGNNPTLGPHAPLHDAPLATAARWLLITHLYSSGGLHTFRPHGTGKGKFVASRLRRSMSVHPVGSTLAETLLLHLMPVHDGYETGSPFWEAQPADDPTAPPSSRAGLLEQLAGRHDKTVLLHPGPTGRAALVVASEGPGRNEALEYPDPFLVRTADRTPFKPPAGRDAWRDIDALVIHSERIKAKDRLEAEILSWWRNNGIEATPRRWAVVTHRANKSNELGWEIASLPDLVTLFASSAAANTAGALVAAAEDASKALGKRVAAASREIGGAARYQDARPVFWAGAETTFWEAVTAASPDPTTEADWWDHLRGHALAGFDAATRHWTSAPRTHMEVELHRSRLSGWGRPERTRGRSNAATPSPGGSAAATSTPPSTPRGAT